MVLGVRSWSCVAMLVLAACSVGPADESEPDESLCNGNTAMNCVRESYGEDHEYQAWSRQECGAGTQCQVAGEGRAAICAYGPPRPACSADDGFVCDGTELLRCHGGYVVDWQHCTSCATSGPECSDFGWGATDCCKGKMDDTCQDDDECVEGLVCVAHPDSTFFKTCSLACDCPDGPCAACVHSTSSHPQAMCYHGVCLPA